MGAYVRPGVWGEVIIFGIVPAGEVMYEQVNPAGLLDTDFVVLSWGPQPNPADSYTLAAYVYLDGGGPYVIVTAQNTGITDITPGSVPVYLRVLR